MKIFRLLFIAALLAIVALSLSCSSSAPDGEEQFTAAPDGAGQFNAAPDGAELYRARCGACHGEKGEGLVESGIPPVTKTPMTVEQLVSLIVEGKSGTNVHASPIVNITGEEAHSIAGYIKTLE